MSCLAALASPGFRMLLYQVSIISGIQTLRCLFPWKALPVSVFINLNFAFISFRHDIIQFGRFAEQAFAVVQGWIKYSVRVFMNICHLPAPSGFGNLPEPVLSFWVLRLECGCLTFLRSGFNAKSCFSLFGFASLRYALQSCASWSPIPRCVFPTQIRLSLRYHAQRWMALPWSVGAQAPVHATRPELLISFTGFVFISAFWLVVTPSYHLGLEARCRCYHYRTYVASLLRSVNRPMDSLSCSRSWIYVTGQLMWQLHLC